jgi:hypothetical protein
MITRTYVLEPGQGKTVIIAKSFPNPRSYTGRLVDSHNVVVDSTVRFGYYEVQAEIPDSYVTESSLPATLTLYATKAGGSEETLATINLIAPEITQAPTTDTPSSTSVLSLGVKGDVRTVTDAAITSGSNQLSSTSAAFTTSDIGKKVQVVGAGAAFNNRGAWASGQTYVYNDLVTRSGVTYVTGEPQPTPGATSFNTRGWTKQPANSQTLMATITGVSSGVATLSANAGTTVSGAKCVFGTDDSAAVQALPAGEYYFPGNKTYFLVDWFIPSHTRITIGAGATFKIPSYPTTDCAVFRLLTSNRLLTTYVEDVYVYGTLFIDGTELTPPSGTTPRGVHILNAQNWYIQAVHARGLPTVTGNAVQTGSNQAGIIARHGEIGFIQNENVRGVGASCVQHTGGTQIEYGTLICDGGVAFRNEMDSNASVTHSVNVGIAYANADSGFDNAAVMFSPHTQATRNVEVGLVLAEGGPDGSKWEYGSGGSIEDITIRKMRVTGGGSASQATANDLVFPGCVIYDATVEGASATPGLRSLAGTSPGYGFIYAPGMTLVNCKAKGNAVGGFTDVFAASVVAGTKATLVNPVAENNVGPGIYNHHTEKLTILGGAATDTQGSPTQTFGINGATGTTVTYLGTIISGNGAATGGAGTKSTPTIPGAWNTLSLTGFGTTSGYRAPSYRIEGDVVRFRGSLNASSAYSAGTTIFTLPVGARPVGGDVRIPTLTQNGANVALLIQASTGNAWLTSAVTSGNWATIDGLSFTI